MEIVLPDLECAALLCKLPTRTKKGRTDGDSSYAM